MKRLIASRKLKRTCTCCNRSFRRGEVYYKQRHVWEEDGEIYASEYLICPRCKYEIEQSTKRFEDYKLLCTHPDWAIETKYRYIPGECS